MPYRVYLQKGRTYSVQGHTFEKGKMKIIQDAELAAYLQQTREFHVEEYAERVARPVPAPLEMEEEELQRKIAEDKPPPAKPPAKRVRKTKK